MMSSRSKKVIPLPSPFNGDRLLSRREAAEYLHTSVRWLESQRTIPTVNIAAPNSRRAMVRYRRADLDRFLDSRMVLGPSAGGR
jgi:hypothetical protein